MVQNQLVHSVTKRSRARPSSRLRLTDKEKKFIAARLKGLNMQDAALEAGYSARNPSTSATRAMQQVENKAPDVFGQNGLDDDAFVKKCVIPALFATERKIFQHNGQLIYSKPQVAWNARNTATALVARMKGMIKEEQSQAPAGVKVLIVNAAYRPPRRPQSNGNPPENGAPLDEPTGPQEPHNGN